MKIPDLQLKAPEFPLDPSGTRQMAAYTAKLEEIILDIYRKLGTVSIVATAPTLSELEERALASGETRSDIKILDDATQTNRRIYYRKDGVLRFIESD